MVRGTLAFTLFAVAVTGCSDSEFPVDEWTPLLSGSWTLGPGEEKYVCVRRTLDEDIEVSGFRPVAPVGTHHTMLSVADGGAAGPDGISDCDGATNGQLVLFASGLGTDDLRLPGGVAVRIRAGTRLLLNVHLVNASGGVAKGETGVTALVVDSSKVEEHAEVVLAGKVQGLEVLPGKSSQTGVCTFPIATTLFAFMPHMHARGARLKVVAKRAAGAVTVSDAAFDVNDQRYVIADPAVAMGAGDELEVICEYDNPSNTTFAFGPKATDEMCYAITVRYPAVGGPALCTK